MNETEAEVIGLDWRIPLDQSSGADLKHRCARAGKVLDPAVMLFADWKELKPAPKQFFNSPPDAPGHIFNRGHGILARNSG